MLDLNHESLDYRSTVQENHRYLEVIQRVEAIQESYCLVLDLLMSNREASRLDDRARSLIALNAFLDETQEACRMLQNFLGFSLALELEDWPTVAQWLRLPQSEEKLAELAEFVAGKRDPRQALPVTSVKRFTALAADLTRIASH